MLILIVCSKLGCHIYQELDVCSKEEHEYIQAELEQEY